MQFPATGVTDKLGAPAHWKVPTYTERFAFIQIVRTWAAHANRRGSGKLRLPQSSGERSISILDRAPGLKVIGVEPVPHPGAR